MGRDRSLLGAGSRWAQGLRGPTGLVPPARWVQPLPSPPQARAEGRGASATACPPCPATPGDVPCASQATSTPGGLLLSPQLLSASTAAETPPGTSCGRSVRGARPPHGSASPGTSLPRAGDGHRQPPGSGQTQRPRGSGSSVPQGVSSGGHGWGWAGRASRELQVSDQVDPRTGAVLQGWEHSGKGLKPTNLTHPQGHLPWPTLGSPLQYFLCSFQG